LVSSRPVESSAGFTVSGKAKPCEIEQPNVCSVVIVDYLLEQYSTVRKNRNNSPKGVYRMKKIAAQKITVEYFSFHGGDLLPYPVKNTLAHTLLHTLQVYYASGVSKLFYFLSATATQSRGIKTF